MNWTSGTFRWAISSSVFGTRSMTLYLAGFLWCFAFLLPWIPLPSIVTNHSLLLGIHFCLSLCAFDTFLTWVLIVHCALLADLTLDSVDRNTYNSVNSLGLVFGAMIGASSYVFYDKEDLTHFRVFCVFIALLASGGFWFTGTYLRVQRTKRYAAMDPVSDGLGLDISGMFTFAKQVLRQGNFVKFVIVNMLQTLASSFEANFFVLFDEILFAPVLPGMMRRAIVFTRLYLTHLTSQLMTPFANKFGTYKLVLTCTAGRFCVAVVIAMVGMHHHFIWATAYMLMILLARAGSFFDLSFADVIDEDKLIHRRPFPHGTSMHGIMSLFVKPVSSVGPVLGMFVLPVQDTQIQRIVDAEHNHQTVFFALWAMPMVCALLQWCVWSTFTLHSSRLRFIKHELALIESVELLPMVVKD
eukprot:c16599_g1_i2.p1 GENE.c16599_g1_i2~~c16599_g1_i2.p1  ORF type:complete len:413 (+),score=92.89 c16599_g1_i2:145-1383(+)